MKLINLFLNPVLQRHLNKYDTDFKNFLDDHDLLRHKIINFFRETRNDVFIIYY